MEKCGYYAAGYAGPCGFFGGDGADAAGAGLRDPRHQRHRRRAGPYRHLMGAAAALSGPHFPVHQHLSVVLEFRIDGGRDVVSRYSLYIKLSIPVP